MRALIACAVHTPGVESLLSGEAPRVDITIAADGGARLLLAAGITPDLVVGDADSLVTGELEQLKALGVPFELHPKDKDETDLDLALNSARIRGVNAVCVFGATGGRLDHTLGAIGSLSRAIDMAPEIVDPGIRGWILGTSGRTILDLVGEGSLVSVQSLSSSAVVTSAGLRWPLDGIALPSLGTRGVSNRILGRGASVSVVSGVVLVTTCHDDDGSPLARRAD